MATRSSEMEKQGEYNVQQEVDEAMDMLGKGYEPSITIEPERTIMERRGKEFKTVVVPAFVKISTAFKDELGLISDEALKVWLFIALSVNRNTGKANPGLRTIAAATGHGVNTVQDCLKELEGLGLLEVDRQSRKFNIYEPIGYVSANRSDPVSQPDTDEKTVSEEPETVSETPQSVSETPQSVSASQILNQRNQSNQNKPDLLDAELHYHLKPKAIKDAFAKFFKLTPNWEAKYNRQYLEWMVAAEVTPEQVEHAANTWKSDKRFNWKEKNLRDIQQHWLELIEQVISKGMELSQEEVERLQKSVDWSVT